MGLFIIYIMENADKKFFVKAFQDEESKSRYCMFP
jgi:hypothetical protein